MTNLTGELKEVSTLEVLREEIQLVCEVALKQRIGCQGSKDAALAIGANVKRMRKALDDRRKQITNPMQDMVKRVIAFADELDRPLEKAESHIRSQAVAYAGQIAEQQRKAQAAIEMEKARLRREEETKMRNAAAMADSFDEQLKAQDRVKQEAIVKQRELKIEAQEVKAQGVKGTTEVWTFEVTDANLVPREYLVVLPSAIRAAVTRLGVREIPGVRIYAETKVRL